METIEEKKLDQGVGKETELQARVQQLEERVKQLTEQRKQVYDTLMEEWRGQLQNKDEMLKRIEESAKMLKTDNERDKLLGRIAEQLGLGFRNMKDRMKGLSDKMDTWPKQKKEETKNKPVSENEQTKDTAVTENEHVNDAHDKFLADLHVAPEDMLPMQHSNDNSHEQTIDNDRTVG